MICYKFNKILFLMKIRLNVITKKFHKLNKTLFKIIILMKKNLFNWKNLFRIINKS